MKPAGDDLLEGQFSALLAVCDEALAAGLPLPPLEEGSLPEDLCARLRRAQALLALLEDARLPSRLTLLDAAPSRAPTAHVSFDPVAGTGQLGRFRLLRELGRG